MAFGIPGQFDLSVYASLAFLFGIAAQFKAMGGYSLIQSVISEFEKKLGILFAVIVVTSLFSPFILNDVVVIILTPAIVNYSKQFRVNIAPLLVAEITFTNIASSLTPFGNPQNILLWSASKLSFLQFCRGASLPLLIAGGLGALLLMTVARNGYERKIFHSIQTSPKQPAIYLVIVATAVVVASIFALPPYTALGIGLLIGFAFTYKSLVDFVKEFDLRSLAILYGFVTAVSVAAIFLQSQFVPYVFLVGRGVQPYSALFIGIVSNLISNVPATQLVLSSTSIVPQVAPKIAVDAGLAGSIDPIGSFANLLALIIAERAGVPIRKAILLQLLVGLICYVPALL